MTAIPDFSKGQPYSGTSGLLPAIAQDADSGRVLMLAWMDETAWQQTLSSRQAVYFSRSRGKLWRKGESSGHNQQVTEIRVDCDADTILLQVQQTGAACHEERLVLYRLHLSCSLISEGPDDPSVRLFAT